MMDAGVRLTPGGLDECVLEIQLLWETEKEGVIIAIDCPGPNYKVQVWRFQLLTYQYILVLSLNYRKEIWGTWNHSMHIQNFFF